MIEPLVESSKEAVGFKVAGTLTAADIVSLTTRIEEVIGASGMPIGLLVDLSEMTGATWAGRWEQMRFLQRHSDHIVRLAVVSDDKWEDIKEMTVVATAAMQAEARYFLSTETLHAWHWVKRGDPGEGIPVRVMYPGKGLFGDYTPEYAGI